MTANPLAPRCQKAQSAPRNCVGAPEAPAGAKRLSLQTVDESARSRFCRRARDCRTERRQHTSCENAQCFRHGRVRCYGAFPAHRDPTRSSLLLIHMLPLPPRVVIDTQTVMDWLVFRDPSTQVLAQAIDAGHVQWVGCEGMAAELRHVLGRGVAADRLPDLNVIDRAFARCCQQLPSPQISLPRMVCRDPDDQVFIDLAVMSGARWLISRDKAVLALAKRAKLLHGVVIVSLPHWTRLWQGAEGSPSSTSSA